MGERVVGALRFIVYLYLLIFQTTICFGNIWAAEHPAACLVVFKKERAGGDFLHRRDPRLFKSPQVERKSRLWLQAAHLPDSRELNAGEKILAWLEYLDRNLMKQKSDETVPPHLRRWFHRKYVIQEHEIPASYFQLQDRIARELGTTQRNDRKELAAVVTKDQEQSLNAWLNYLIPYRTDSGPAWFRYWVLMGVVKIGKFDPDSGSFEARSRGQVAPFPDLNPEALGLVKDAILKRVYLEHAKANQSSDFLAALETENFGKIYGHILRKLKLDIQERPMSLDGKWVKFPKDSDHRPLVESLEGMSTGWCTVGEATAKSQLELGDFHVFYSNDENNQPRIPRVAIRLEGSRIAEIRGVAKNQNLDPQIASSSVLDDKLKEFGDEVHIYQKQSADMRMLTEIEKKQNAKVRLSKSELRFLYELDSTIEGFGSQRDPRIQEILGQRRRRSDLAHAFGLRVREVSITQEDAFREGIKVHFGNLDLGEVNIEERIIMPEEVRGDIDASRIKSLENLVLPKRLFGSIDFFDLTDDRGAVYPEIITGNMWLRSLQVSQAAAFTKKIFGDLYMTALKTARGFDPPESIGKSLHLSALPDGRGLNLSRTTIGRDLILPSLQFIDDAELPVRVGRDMTLDALQNSKSLNLPIVGRNLWITSMKSPKGLKFQGHVHGLIYYNSDYKGAFESALGEIGRAHKKEY